jgi:hypothetical protein
MTYAPIVGVNSSGKLDVEPAPWRAIERNALLSAGTAASPANLSPSDLRMDLAGARNVRLRND